MDQIINSYVNFGSLGLMVAVLLIAVKVLYNRNTKLNDRLHEIIIKNTEAYNNHSIAINKLTEVVSNITEVIHLCKRG